MRHFAKIRERIAFDRKNLTIGVKLLDLDEGRIAQHQEKKDTYD